MESSSGTKGLGLLRQATRVHWKRSAPLDLFKTPKAPLFMDGEKPESTTLLF